VGKDHRSRSPAARRQLVVRNRRPLRPRLLGPPPHQLRGVSVTLLIPLEVDTARRPP
jgi:hypothetical protein